MSGMVSTRSTRLARIISTILAPVFAIQPAFAWYIGVFGKPEDPFVPATEPIISASPLAFEWWVAIWLFVTARFVFEVLLIYCAWFGFQRLLDIYEMQAVIQGKMARFE